jgi:hypothetical protein
MKDNKAVAKKLYAWGGDRCRVVPDPKAATKTAWFSCKEEKEKKIGQQVRLAIKRSV